MSGDMSEGTSGGTSGGMIDALPRLPFAEQVRYFARKLNLPTTGWTDIMGHEHDWAFVVAGAARDDLLCSLREAVQQAIEDGTPLSQFRSEFDRIVERTGWSYRGGRNWRTRTIYETNLRSSYQAGRWQQLQHAPYWQYVHDDDVRHPRPEHQAWDGLILKREDPWWREHYPPNGWGCRCTVRGLWAHDLERLGRSGPDEAPAVRWVQRVIGQRSSSGARQVSVPDGIDPGFAHAPGAARLQSAIPPELPQPVTPDGSASMGGHGLPNTRPPDELPPARPMPASALLEQGQEPQHYVSAFLAGFGATIEQPAVWRDVTGEAMVMGADLFRNSRGQWKVLKRGRERYLALLAEAIRDPDEVWVRLQWDYGRRQAVVRRRYVCRFAIEGEDVPLLLVFERGRDGWTGVTAFAPEQTGYAEESRLGVRIYRRR